MTRILYAGIDGGGTKTAIVIVDETGNVVSRVQVSTSNAAVVGHEAAGTVLRQGITDALAAAGPDAILASAWFGLSGSDRPEDHQRLRPHVAGLATEIRMSNDAELLLGALPGSIGVAVVSGTGSIAFGRAASGERARAGGWGHIFGDEGSGYDLARRALDAYSREIDGRGPSTSLTPRLKAHLGLVEPYQLIAWAYAKETTKGDIARLSRLVVTEADAGDAVARGIVEGSARELATTVGTVARRLGFSHALPLALTGGMLVQVATFRQLVLDRLRGEWPEIHAQLVDDPALAAARSLCHTHTAKAPSP